MAEMVRVNTRISKNLNDWLDEQTEETGLPKSTQIMLAVEMYQQQKQAKGQLTELSILIEKMQGLTEKIKEQPRLQAEDPCRKAQRTIDNEWPP